MLRLDTERRLPAWLFIGAVWLKSELPPKPVEAAGLKLLPPPVVAANGGTPNVLANWWLAPNCIEFGPSEWPEGRPLLLSELCSWALSMFGFDDGRGMRCELPPALGSTGGI